VPRLAWSEFDAFEEALRGVQGRYLLTRRAVQDWRLRIVDLGDITLMLGQDGAGNLYHGTSLPDRVTVFIALTASETVAVDGCEMGRESIAWFVPEKEFHIRASGVTRWLAVSIAASRVTCWLDRHADDAGHALLGNPLVLRQTGAGAMQALMTLARRVLRADANQPELLQAPCAREMLCQQLVDAVFAAVRVADGAVPPGPDGRPRLSRHGILVRTLRMIDQRIDQPIHADELCSAAGVSGRTLRAIFHEHFAMSPHKYLMLKRLHAIHLALRAANRSDTVSDICGRYGVWDFGRFARKYRRQFGVLPSQVLRRAALS
jgi:AraC family ethanolamine operon transcriptional activator